MAESIPNDKELTFVELISSTTDILPFILATLDINDCMDFKATCKLFLEIFRKFHVDMKIRITNAETWKAGFTFNGISSAVGVKLNVDFEPSNNKIIDLDNIVLFLENEETGGHARFVNYSSLTYMSSFQREDCRGYNFVTFTEEDVKDKPNSKIICLTFDTRFQSQLYSKDVIIDHLFSLKKYGNGTHSLVKFTIGYFEVFGLSKSASTINFSIPYNPWGRARVVSDSSSSSE
jgi:hypothetical protein